MLQIWEQDLSIIFFSPVFPENNGDGADADDEAFIRRQTKKLR